MRFLDFCFPDSLDKLMLIFGAMLGTVLQFAFGQWTTGLTWLGCFAIGDFCTGSVAAFRNGEWNSDSGMKGIFRKVMLFAFVSLAHGIDVTLHDTGLEVFSFMSLTVTALSVTECGSIIENLDRAGLGSFVPAVIRQGLKTIREAADRKMKQPQEKADVKNP